MKNIAVFLIFTIGYTVGFCQVMPFLDSMKKAMIFEKRDTTYIDKLQYISGYYRNLNNDSARSFAQQALSLSNEIGYYKGKIQALEAIGLIYRGSGDIPTGLDIFLQGLQVAENNNFAGEGVSMLINIAHIYRDLEDYDNAINYYKRANEILEVKHNDRVSAFLLWNIGNSHKKMNRLDSSLFYKRKAYEKFKLINLELGYEYMMLGDIEFEFGNHTLALDLLRKSIVTSRKLEMRVHEIFGYTTIADFFSDLKQTDSCINYANKALALAKKMSIPIKLLEASKILSAQYESLDIKEALHYRKIADSVRETLFGASKVQSLQKIVTNEQERRRRIETENIAIQNKLKQYALMAGLLVSFVIAFLLFRNNRNKQKSNILMAATLANLKATQSQLIHSEKMASLGELTAGIAHEILNPLNFVNNFSEVNKELIGELKLEADKGNIAELKLIADNIEDNDEKIIYHGKRADSIVKGMLQHSQKGSGQKEPADINAMAEEYLRLAYHACLSGRQGYRTKDITLNVSFVTDFDKSIENVNLVQQDISRVLLNLYNNAFYALSAKSSAEALAKADGDYQPMVTLTTKRKEEFIEISIKDNGSGIPENIREKIFQPFFTTKPTGQGTGLGLSLSYDIVKAHGGELSVDSKEGEGSEFVIQLPIA